MPETILTNPPVGPQARPRDASYWPDLLGGPVIEVADGASPDQVQAALNKIPDANGTRVVLAGGADYIGNFSIPPVPYDWRWCLCGSREADVYRAGRMTTKAFAQFAPKLTTPNAQSALACNDGVHGGKLVGLEVRTTLKRSVVWQLLAIGGGASVNGWHRNPATESVQQGLDRISRRFAVVGCYIHGEPDAYAQRGIYNNGWDVRVEDTFVGEIHNPGFDSQGVLTHDTPGVHLYRNCELQGSGQCYMSGGADTSGDVAFVPSDVVFDRVRFFKPLTWCPYDPSFGGIVFVIKPTLEMKTGHRFQYLNCEAINSWNWPAIVFDAFNQGGWQPFMSIEDVDVQNFKVSNAVGFFQSWRDSTDVKRIRIMNSLGVGLFDPRARFDPDGSKGVPINAYGRGITFNLAASWDAVAGREGAIEDLWLENNSVLGLQGMMVQGAVLPRLRMVNNLLGFGGHGMAKEGVTGGWAVPFTGDLDPAWATIAPGGTLRHNAWVNVTPEDMTTRTAEKPWNARKYWSLSGFFTQDEHQGAGVDLVTGALAATSPLAGYGVDFVALGTPGPQDTTGPVPTPTPTPTPEGHMEGYFDGFMDNKARGWAWDQAAPTARVTVALFVDGVAAGAVTANLLRPDLVTAGKGDGLHGWEYTIPDSYRDGKAHTLTCKVGATELGYNGSNRFTLAAVTPTPTPTPTGALTDAEIAQIRKLLALMK
jgi:hypothetical protein